jgi:hypothetical protein
MTLFFRQLLFFLIFLSILSIERALGLPFISLVLASNYLAPAERISKSIGLFLTGLFLAMSYFIPIWLGIVIVAALVFMLENRVILFHRETLTYFVAVAAGVFIIGYVSHFPLSPSNIFYHLCLALVCLFFIRFWSIKKTSKLKLG